ncbi:MAG: response regulator [Candidatus Nomurabacteria bacterium]|nr:response regulator [Candidatus Nomurabacteria bacterium]
MNVKILLVEDDKNSQLTIYRLLKSNNLNYVSYVSFAENGKEAIELVESQKFSLILMNIQMPIMDGLKATKKIREILGYENIPIIAVTALAMSGDRKKCLEAGATDYLPKPIDSKEFLDMVNFYINKEIQA